MYQTHSAIGQSAWIDLLRLLRQQALADIRGKPRKKLVRGKAYWYDQYRLGAQVVDRYLGEDSAEMQARLAQHSAGKGSTLLINFHASLA